MASQITVDTLLTGSQRINEMSSQINSMASIIFGFIKKEDLKKWRFEETIFEFTVKGYRWHISRAKTSIWCNIYDSGSTSTLPVAGLPVDDQLNLPLKSVIPIYYGLEQFISEMIARFPQLEERMAPLIEAAKMGTN